MHRSALRLRPCCQPKLRSFFNVHSRGLPSASTVPVVSSDKQAVEPLEPWQDRSGKALASRENDTKDVIVEDLSATLEAHRASNRAAVIREIEVQGSNSLGSFLRPSLDNGDGGSEVEEIHEAKEEGREDEPPQMWPADSVQAKERYGRTGSIGFFKKTDPLEYTGVAQWPKQPWKINHSSKDMPMQRPWLAYMGTTNEDYLERLTAEIKAYEAYMRLSPQEESASQLVISDVNSVAHNEPDIKPLTLIGSRSTGLATPISDFDFTFTTQKSLPGGWILPPNETDLLQAQSSNYAKKLKALKALRKVDKHFRSSHKFSNTDCLWHARVPIIRSKHVATGLDVQLQTLAPYQIAQEQIITYLSEFPSLRPLYIILRYCLEVRGLTTVFGGGLGSYSILIMIVTALKHSSDKFASDDLGGQMLHVLDFYGKADLYKVGFSADPPRVFEKQKEGWSLEEQSARTADSQPSGTDQMQKLYPRKPYLLCLQDPANDLNDLGKSAYAIKHIQATFNKASESIQALLERKKEGSDDRAKDKIWSCLDSVARADYRPFEVRRSRVERCANPRKLDDRGYSKERIERDFEKRVNRYKGIAEEDNNVLESAVEPIEGNAADGIEAENGSSDISTGPAWHPEPITPIQERRDRTKYSKERKTAFIATKNEPKPQRPFRTNDDEYGWEPSSSPSDPKTLLEAIAAPKSVLAARTLAPKRKAGHRKHRMGLIRRHCSGDFIHKYHLGVVRKYTSAERIRKKRGSKNLKAGDTAS